MGKRSFALLLALVLTATLFSACTKGTTGQTETTAKAQTTFATDNDNFKLSYTQSDSLDPFAAKTQNNQVLADLVFESLFDLDGSYTAQPNLATGYEFTDSTTLKVIVPSGLTFSDKSALTVADVVYSFEQAKNSPAYGSALQGIRSATAEDNNTVVFTLRHPSPYGQNLLTFPIAKANAKGKYPIGSGRYRYKSTQNGPVLTANVTADFNPHITTIHLVNIAAADSIDNAVNIGNITYAYRDLSENSAKRMTATKKQINQNNLVYIGFNNRFGAFANAHLRKAVSLAVDRNALAKSAYAGYATAARSVYNPAFGLAASTRLFAEAADAAAAKQQIALSKVSDSALKITLLVNKNDNRLAAANQIKTALEAAGFTVQLQVSKFSDYKARIKNLNYDLYIGEVKLQNDMCLYPFFSTDGAARYGISQDKGSTAALYRDYTAGKTELGKFMLSFSEEMPFAPLVYRKGMICYSKSLRGDIQGQYGNFFANIEDWYFG